MRIRDIIHASGRRLRIGLAAPSGGEPAILQLSDPSRPATIPVLLDLYGSELLASFLMSARLAAEADGSLAEERCGGPLACRMRLTGDTTGTVIELAQAGEPLFLPHVLWDRLYAELLLALAHARNLALGQQTPASGPKPWPPLLH